MAFDFDKFAALNRRIGILHARNALSAQRIELIDKIQKENDIDTKAKLWDIYQALVDADRLLEPIYEKYNQEQQGVIVNATHE